MKQMIDIAERDAAELRDLTATVGRKLLHGFFPSEEEVFKAVAAWRRSKMTLKGFNDSALSQFWKLPYVRSNVEALMRQQDERMAEKSVGVSVERSRAGAATVLRTPEQRKGPRTHLMAILKDLDLHERIAYYEVGKYQSQPVRLDTATLRVYAQLYVALQDFPETRRMLQSLYPGLPWTNYIIRNTDRADPEETALWRETAQRHGHLFEPSTTHAPSEIAAIVTPAEKPIAVEKKPAPTAPILQEPAPAAPSTPVETPASEATKELPPVAQAAETAQDTGEALAPLPADILHALTQAGLLGNIEQYGWKYRQPGGGAFTPPNIGKKFARALDALHVTSPASIPVLLERYPGVRWSWLSKKFCRVFPPIEGEEQVESHEPMREMPAVTITHAVETAEQPRAEDELVAVLENIERELTALNAPREVTDRIIAHIQTYGSTLYRLTQDHGRLAMRAFLAPMDAPGSAAITVTVAPPAASTPPAPEPTPSAPQAPATDVPLPSEEKAEAPVSPVTERKAPEAPAPTVALDEETIRRDYPFLRSVSDETRTACLALLATISIPDRTPGKKREFPPDIRPTMIKVHALLKEQKIGWKFLSHYDIAPPVMTGWRKELRTDAAAPTKPVASQPAAVTPAAPIAAPVTDVVPENNRVAIGEYAFLKAADDALRTACLAKLPAIVCGEPNAAGHRTFDQGTRDAVVELYDMLLSVHASNAFLKHFSISRQLVKNWKDAKRLAQETPERADETTRDEPPATGQNDATATATSEAAATTVEEEEPVAIGEYAFLSGLRADVQRTCMELLPTLHVAPVQAGKRRSFDAIQVGTIVRVYDVLLETAYGAAGKFAAHFDISPVLISKWKKSPPAPKTPAPSPAQEAAPSPSSEPIQPAAKAAAPSKSKPVSDLEEPDEGRRERHKKNGHRPKHTSSEMFSWAAPVTPVVIAQPKTTMPADIIAFEQSATDGLERSKRLAILDGALARKGDAAAQQQWYATHNVTLQQVLLWNRLYGPHRNALPQERVTETVASSVNRKASLKLSPQNAAKFVRLVLPMLLSPFESKAAWEKQLAQIDLSSPKGEELQAQQRLLAQMTDITGEDGVFLRAIAQTRLEERADDDRHIWRDSILERFGLPNGSPSFAFADALLAFQQDPSKGPEVERTAVAAFSR